MARDDRRSSAKKKSITLVTPPFRMAFPALLKPEETDNGERYKVTALFPPDADLGKIEDAMYDVMEDAFGPKADWPNGRNDVHPADKLYPAEKNDKWTGFKKGWKALPMSSTEAPGIIDADKNEVMSAREIYGGRWARAQVNITTYDNKSRGVGVYLNHVQLLDHDEAFSGRGNAEDAFDKYEMRDRSSGRDRSDRDRDSRSERGRDDRRDNSRDRDEGRDRNSSRGDDRRNTRENERGREERGRMDRKDDRRPSERDREKDEGRSRDRDERSSSRDRDRRSSSEDDWN